MSHGHVVRVVLALETAFTVMKQNNIIAESQWTCCQSCGRGAMDRLLEVETEAKGFVFYHDQDADHLREKGECFLCFGSRNGVAEETIAVGKEAVEILERFGLNIDWDGTAERRILVKGVKPHEMSML